MRFRADAGVFSPHIAGTTVTTLTSESDSSHCKALGGKRKKNGHGERNAAQLPSLHISC